MHYKCCFYIYFISELFQFTISCLSCIAVTLKCGLVWNTSVAATSLLVTINCLSQSIIALRADTALSTKFNGANAALSTNGADVALSTNGINAALSANQVDGALSTNGPDEALPTNGANTAMSTNGAKSNTFNPRLSTVPSVAH